MNGFSGFPGGPVQLTVVPDLFFSELLTEIDDLAELKLTLHALWRLYRKQGQFRYLSRAELEQDGLLLGSLRRPGQNPLDVLAEALERATIRGSLLRLRVVVDGKPEEWYCINTERSRQTIAALERGELEPEVIAMPVVPLAVPDDRPTIFTLYEQNVGLLQPLIAEELREAATTFPPDWLEEAFRVAAQRNIRSWRYIRTILERWAHEGRDNGTAQRGTETDRAERTRRRFRDELE
jgi:DNA replication protein